MADPYLTLRRSVSQFDSAWGHAVIVSNMITCTKCKTAKPEDDFAWSKRDVKRASWCKTCHSEYTKQHYARDPSYYVEKRKRRGQMLAQYIRDAKNKPCTDCKGIYPSVCMDFDHIGDDKEYNLAHMAVVGSLKKINAEIAKCEVVCANCHRIRTAQRRAHVVESGIHTSLRN